MAVLGPDITGVRKSAILLLSLGQDQAAEILKRLPPEAVEEVSREIASLSEIPVDARKEVFTEFYNLALANSYVSEGGLEYAKTLLKMATLNGAGALGLDPAIFMIEPGNTLAGLVALPVDAGEGSPLERALRSGGPPTLLFPKN